MPHTYWKTGFKKAKFCFLLQVVGTYSNGATDTFNYAVFNVGPATSFYRLTVGGMTIPAGQVSTW
jgi:hypothetical protein